MGDNMRRKCLKCGSSPQVNPDIKLYRFPKPGVSNVKRCELWAKFCFPNGAWSSVDFQQKLYAEHRMLCCSHFQTESFTDFAAKTLNRHAFPEVVQVENQTTPDYSAAQPELSHSTINPTSGISQIFKKITNIQQYKVIPVTGDISLMDNFFLDISKDCNSVSAVSIRGTEDKNISCKIGSPEPPAASTLDLLPVAVSPTPIQEVIDIDCIIEDWNKPGEGGQSVSTFEPEMVDVATSPTPHHVQSPQRDTEPRRVIRGRRRLLHSPATAPSHRARAPRRHFNATEQFLNSEKHWRNLATKFVTEHVRLRERELQQQSQWQTLFAKLINVVENIANKINSK